MHEHSQILGLPFVPTQIDAELRGSLAHFERTGRNVFDDIVAEELRSGERVLCDDERFLAVVPYAARAPLECWIIPKFPGADFAETTDDDLARVGDILHELVHRVDGLQPHFPFNMVVHTAPAGLDDHTFYRWHIELMPRAGALAGFELGTGVYINAMAPEDAARQLRDVAIDG